MQHRLSLLPLLTHSSVTLNFLINIPCDAAFRQNYLITALESVTFAVHVSVADRDKIRIRDTNRPRLVLVLIVNSLLGHIYNIVLKRSVRAY